MALLHSRRFIHCTARRLTRHKVDADGLPLAPTWSVHSLLNTSSPSTAPSLISNDQLDHLFRLSQLRPPKDKADRTQLAQDMDDLTRFIHSIQQKDFGNTEPVTHIWQASTGMTLRSDDKENADKVKGTALLDNAKQTVNPFYTVKGQHQEE
ncbi:hypothetical protein [Absidia glauca]|uniref:Glutamyl-tRNA amidotransferase complex subunit Gta3 domain-containing protein n=1 Tax=Absidia glauca TaxID=4829 RepID=A0A168KWT5_ABSGL|nr:hypothetical protein [Absidia glauca]